MGPEADDFWVDVADAEPESAPWLIRGLLPAGLVFIGGPAKTMKTTLLVGMANLVSGHECTLLPSFMSKVELDGLVMLLEAEATPGQVRKMVEEDMGVKLEHGGILQAKDSADFRLDDPGAMKRLLFWLNKFKPRLFACDPMREFHDLDEKDSGDMQRLLRPLRRWALDNDSCFLVVHHTTKPGEQHTGVYNPLDLRGSGGLFGAANGVIMVSPTKVNGQLIINAQYKHGEPWTRTIQLGVFGRKAREVLSLAEAQVLKILRMATVDSRGLKVVSEKTMAAKLGEASRERGGNPVSEDWVKETLRKLERNNLASRLVDRPDCWIANTEGVENA